MSSLFSTDKSLAGKNWFSRKFLFAFDFESFSYLDADDNVDVDLLTSFEVVEEKSERGEGERSEMEVLAWRRGWKRSEMQLNMEMKARESVCECVESEKGESKGLSFKADKFKMQIREG